MKKTCWSLLLLVLLSTLAMAAGSRAAHGVPASHGLSMDSNSATEW